MRYRYDYKGTTHEVRLQRLPDGRIEATIAERTYIVHASHLKQGEWLIIHEGDHHRLHTSAEADARYVQYGGVHYQLMRQQGRRRRSGVVQGAGDMTAQMPSQIMEILVEEGEAVTAGQALIVLEAMKMEIRVSATADGIIKRVLVQPGQIVERGQTLIEMAQKEDAS